jgi:gluconolactonase
MQKRQLRFLLLILAAGAVLIALGPFRAQLSSAGAALVRADPRFDRLVASGARLEHLAGRFGLAEGPAWNKKDGHLLFSDLPSNSIFRWQRGSGAQLFLRPSGYSGSEPFAGSSPGSNGLAFDSAGRLVICEHGDRRITRLERDGRRSVLVDRYDGKRLNSPNDLVFNSRGELFFTDPPYGLPRSFADPGRELDFSGVYRLSTDGRLTLLTRDVSAPNGIALSPSEKTLYLSNSDAARPAWIAYDIAPDGTLMNGRVFAETPAWARGRAGVHDGMKVDRAGNVFASGPGGIHVFAPDGAHLGSIELPAATNLAWGDDGSVLYITTSTALYRIQTLTKGLGF